jgi:dimethylamine/trimethylamine dehydrogenase
MRDPRYDILFTPLQIGPVVAKNRFYQVPHCNGMGHAMPMAHAAMREMKAAGGWAVVSTEECEIHPSSDETPYVEARLWDDRDIPALALMCDKVHAYGALAALELVHNGPAASNLYSREVLLAPSHQPTKYGYPAQARAMTLHDIREYRRWHREAAIRGKRAGMDIIYVYAAHDLSLPMHFLQRRRNQRTDEYGGSLENRIRFPLEVTRALREAWPAEYPMFLRISASDWIEGGWDVEQSIVFAREAAALGVDLIDVSSGGLALGAKVSVGPGYQVPFAEQIKAGAAIRTGAVGMITDPEQADEIIQHGKADIVLLARAMLRNPYWPHHAAVSLGVKPVVVKQYQRAF